MAAHEYSQAVRSCSQSSGRNVQLAVRRLAGNVNAQNNTCVAAMVSVASGATAVRNDLGGYSIMQAETKEALAEKLKGHPHFMTPDGFIEAVEIMPMPGT